MAAPRGSACTHAGVLSDFIVLSFSRSRASMRIVVRVGPPLTSRRPDFVLSIMINYIGAAGWIEWSYH